MRNAYFFIFPRQASNLQIKCQDVLEMSKSKGYIKKAKTFQNLTTLPKMTEKTLYPLGADFLLFLS